MSKAAQIADLEPVSAADQMNAVSNAPEEDSCFAFPMSPAQSRMRDASLRDPGNPAYNASFRLRLTGPVDEGILAAVFNEVVRRHEALRSIFPEIDGKPVQLVQSSLRVSIKTSDLRRLPLDDRNADMEQLCLTEARNPFNLSIGPLIRVGLIRMAQEDYVMTLTLHHIICDGWAIGLILDEIEALYDAFAAGSPSPLAEPAIQLADFIMWQKDYLEKSDLTKQIAYWRRRLQGYEPLEIPADRPRNSSSTFAGEIISVALPGELTDRLKAYNTSRGSTMFATTLAACKALLCLYTGRTDVGVGSPQAGRDRAEVESTVGLFVNPVILRTDISGDPTLEELTSRVRDTVLEAFANLEIPYERLVKALQPDRDLVSKPFYRINFICQREYGRASRFAHQFAGIRMVSMPSKCQGALYDIQFFLVERRDGWRLSCEYNTDLYQSDTASQMLHHLQEILRAIAANPNQKLSEIAFSGQLPKPAAIARSLEADVTRVLAGSAQRRFWLLNQLTPDNPALHMPASVRIRGPLRVDVLQQSLDEMVQRHDILRTGFVTEGGDLWQVIASNGTLELEKQSFADLPDLERESQVLRRLHDAPRTKFDLSQGPLIRACLYHLAAEDHVLQITMHHTVSDGWSQKIFQRELWQIYDALLAGNPCPLAPPSVQYSDFVLAQQFRLAGEAIQADLAYWKQNLNSPLPVLELPTDLTPVRRAIPVCGVEHLALPSDLLVALKNFSKRENATVFAVMLACFKGLLFRRSGQTDILVGSPIANRESDTEDLIGPMSSPIALRSNLNGNPSFRELVSRVMDTTTNAFAHKDVPFEMILNELQVQPVKGRNPIFQFYFYYQNAFLQPQRSQTIEIIPLSTVSMGTSCELQLGFIERSESVRATLEYNADLFRPETIRRFLDDFVRLLEGAIASPGEPITNIPLPADTKMRRAIGSGPALVQPAPTGISQQPLDGFSVATDSVEMELVRIWQDLFPNIQISVTANFFDLGGHSLLASRLLLQVASAFHKQIPLATLFEAPTIRQLAAILRSGVSITSSSRLLPIQVLGTKPVFYCVDAGPFFRLLAHHLGSDQPFYGLRLENPEELPEVFKLEDIAAYHIRSLRSAQPRGPYYLGGWCLSGIIAYEMAQQLVAQGEEVSLVALFDSPNPAYFRNLSRLETVRVHGQLVWRKFLLHLLALRALDFRQSVRYLSERIDSIWISSVRKCWRLSYWVQTRLKGSVGSNLRQAQQVVYLASRQYEPKPYDGPVVLFLSADEIWGPYDDPNFGWAKVARGDFEVHVMPGDHSDMFLEPGAGLLAEKLESCFSRVRSNEEPTRPKAATA
jgi:non-ribosomal peptide synthetase component F/thioesterase domain-containing protein